MVIGNEVALRVEELVRPIVARGGLEIVEVVYVQEGGRWNLRVFMDKPGGVNLTDCERVSRELDQVLDEEDFIPHPYTLEVSSPGLERPLKRVEDYVRFRGRMIQITTYASQNGRKKFAGRLVDSNEEGVIISVNDHEVMILWNNIAKAKLTVEI